MVYTPSWLDMWLKHKFLILSRASSRRKYHVACWRALKRILYWREAFTTRTRDAGHPIRGRVAVLLVLLCSSRAGVIFWERCAPPVLRIPVEYSGHRPRSRSNQGNSTYCLEMVTHQVLVSFFGESTPHSHLALKYISSSTQGVARCPKWISYLVASMFLDDGRCSGIPMGEKKNNPKHRWLCSVWRGDFLEEWVWRF